MKKFLIKGSDKKTYEVVAPTRKDAKDYLDDVLEYENTPLINAHAKELHRRFKERAETANFGWYQDNKSICSKIYAQDDKQAQVLTSTINKQGKIKHWVENY
jgi:hypothetical protein